MSFNFSIARVKCNGPFGPRKVHVCKALMSMKDNKSLTSNELDALTKAVDYIKSLESEIVRLESKQTIIVNNVSAPAHSASKSIVSALGRAFGKAS